MSRDSVGPLVLAEVEIHCIKEAARFVAGKLENSVVSTDSIFKPEVDVSFPGKKNKAYGLI